MMLEKFKGLHEGEDCYIIGKGPSLEFLRKTDIGEGIILTINTAIIKAESLRFHNKIYSVQKDKFVHRPKDGNLLMLHKWESELEDIPVPHITFDNLKLGLDIIDFSALSCIKIGQLLGCKKFYFVSFDACTCRNGGTWNPVINNNYADSYFEQCRKMKPFLRDITYEWITPVKQ